MRPSILCLCLLSTGLLSAQDPAPADLPAQLKELHTMVSNPKMEDDFRAIGLIQKLGADFGKKPAADQQKIAKAVGDVFHTGKLRPPNAAHLYRESAAALGKMGENGGKELQKAVVDARFKERDYVPMRAVMITEIGHSKDEGQITWLLEQALRSPSDEIMAAAGEALGNFSDLEVKRRREVVKDLLRKYGEVHAKATQPAPTDTNAPIDFSPQNARETLEKIQGKWQATLRTLTGQSFTAFPDWQRWLNKNPNWTPPKKA